MTKERLRRYGKIKQEQEQLRQRLEEVETVLYYPKIPGLTDMPGGGSKEGNPQEELAIHHIELQQLYKAKIDEMAKELLAIEAAIEHLDETARTLLRYRYLDGLKWDEICQRMNYSWGSVHNIHGAALQQLKEAET